MVKTQTKLKITAHKDISTILKVILITTTMRQSLLKARRLILLRLKIF
jgi:hypothetical protein